MKLTRVSYFSCFPIAAYKSKSTYFNRDYWWTVCAKYIYPTISIWYCGKAIYNWKAMKIIGEKHCRYSL